MLERVKYPEQVGVDSKVVKAWIDFLEINKTRIDSIMVIRDGKVACECHWKPNEAEIPHELFSLSKSITALAIGFAVEEGIIDLNTRVYPKYFPDKLLKLSGKQREYAEELNIHHVIAMKVGKVTSVLDNKEKGDWLEDFLACPFKFRPGTGWKYISENAFLLSWILQKETGMTMTEFLTPRLFEPLNIPVPQWDKNHDDIDAGGWGLKLSAEDISKIAVMFMNKGVYDGKRIISEDWINRSVYPHTDKLYPIYSKDSEYGYQTWIDHLDDGETIYRFTGLYGQHAFMFPEHNAVVVMTAKENRDEIILNPTYDFFPRAFIEATEEVDEAKAEEFKKFLNSKEYKPCFRCPTSRNIAKEKIIGNRLIKVKSLRNLSVISAATFFMWRERIGNLDNLKFNFTEDALELSFTEHGCGNQTIKAGMNGKYERSYLKLGEDIFVCDAQAAWNEDGTLELFLHHTGRSQIKRLIFTFGTKTVKISSKVEPDFDTLAKFNVEFNNGLKVPDFAYNVIKFGIPVFDKAFANPDGLGFFAE